MYSVMRYVILLPPVTKKNHSRIVTNRTTGKPLLIPSKAYKEYEQGSLWFLRPAPNRPVSGAVNVKCLFYMPTKRRVDLPNLLNAIDDILVKAGILEDDNYKIIASHDGSRVYVDKENPRTEIEIMGVCE